MIEEKILSEAYKRISQGKRVALVMVTEAVGSTPRKSGAMMGVFEDSIIGTIGGGNIGPVPGLLPGTAGADESQQGNHPIHAGADVPLRGDAL